MSSVAGAKNIGPSFQNEVEQVRVKYDFSVDAGATGALNLFTAAVDVVIRNFYAVVKTAATSGGSATLKVGITGNDACLITTTEGAVANLTLAAVLQADATAHFNPGRLPAGSSILQTIGTAAFTAGVIEYVIEYSTL